MTPFQMMLAVPAVILGAALLILIESIIGAWLFRILESRSREARSRNKEV